MSLTCIRCQKAGEAPPAHRVPFPPAVKEKVLAAQRAGVRRMILPVENKKDLIDIPPKVKREMEFIFVEDIKEVFRQALVRKIDKKPARG